MYLCPHVRMHICTHGSVVCAFVCKCVCVCVGSVCAAVLVPALCSLPTKVMLGSAEHYAEGQCHPFAFRLPWTPKRRKRKGKRKSKEEGERA